MSSPAVDHRAPAGRNTRTARAAARVVAAAALAADAYVHAKLAGQYDGVSATISQGDLFRIEAGLASLAALLVLVWRRRLPDAYALLVAAGGLGAVLLYRYVDVGAFGPLPNMYEPVWFGDKKLSAVSQVVATVATAFLLLSAPRRRRRRRGVEDASA